MRVPKSAFGPGSCQDFALYFEGESSVHVQSIDEIAAWLRQCEYVSDPDLFDKRDFWQHPTVFEQLRRGDCEDFALWAWRKLAEIGLEAEFFVGRVIVDGELDRDRQHAWVVYRAGEIDFLFEPAARDSREMIRPLAEVQHAYVPHFSVNHRFDTSAFAGCIPDSHRAEPRRSRVSGRS
jgi:predicted transglutaminase-like cysteine proteinase